MHDVYTTAGRRAETGVEAPRPAPEETLQACSAKAAEIVSSLLAGQPNAILRETLERLRLAGLRLPHVLLPAALGVQHKELRLPIAAVLGVRGRWLAAMNPEWRWATLAGESEDNDEILWEEGALGERIAALSRLRRREPDQGLRWVEEVWRAEKADARAAMVAVLEARLNADDEPFLERAIQDRSVKVREVVATLLARIPGSAYAERAAERAESLLIRYEPPAGGLRGVTVSLTGRGRAGRLEVAPPEHMDTEWRRDLPGDMPQRGVGEKAWMISQALSVVPPQHWEEHFGVYPSDLISAARGDWEMALLAGWCQASVLHRESSWAMPLWQACYRLDHDLEGWQTWQSALTVVDLLSQSDLAFAIGQLPRNGELPFRLSSTLQALSAPWQPELSDAFLEGLRQRIGGVCKYGPAQGEEPWVNALPHASMSLASESLERATGFRESLEQCSDLPDYALRRWAPELKRFEETLELRHRLVKEMPL